MNWVYIVGAEKWYMDVNTENIKGHFSHLIAKHATGFIM